MLTYGQIQYICQQTNLIDKEVCRRHDEFLKNFKDGRMTKEQLMIFLQNIWPTGNVRKFTEYLFSLCDRTKKGFIAPMEFIILEWRFSNEKSYLGLVFDMIDTRHKGFLPRDQIETLITSLFELIGHPTGDEHSANISKQQITHFMSLAKGNNVKQLSRHQFMNIANRNWIDEDNGVGSLLTENTC